MKSQQIIFSIWIFLAQSLALWSGQPRAITENGYVIGKVVTTSHGLSYLAFEGIPYAKPPVGDKRFKVSKIKFIINFIKDLLWKIRTVI